jgi:hypothetical protein
MECILIPNHPIITHRVAILLEYVSYITCLVRSSLLLVIRHIYQKRHTLMVHLNVLLSVWPRDSLWTNQQHSALTVRRRRLPTALEIAMWMDLCCRLTVSTCLCSYNYINIKMMIICVFHSDYVWICYRIDSRDISIVSRRMWVRENNRRIHFPSIPIFLFIERSVSKFIPS